MKSDKRQASGEMAPNRHQREDQPYCFSFPTLTQNMQPMQEDLSFAEIEEPEEIKQIFTESSYDSPEKRREVLQDFEMVEENK